MSPTRRPTRAPTPWPAVIAGLAAWAALGVPRAHAQDSATADRPAERVRVQSDTVLRYVPRYELVFDPERPSSEAAYYRQVDQLPLHQRVSLDARNLTGGRLEVHIQAHAVADATLPDDARVLNGGFALAYVRATPLQDTALWGGRRFVTWGVPGGLHLDGAGIELATPLGLYAELLVGRPVTTEGTELGPRAEHHQATVAYGARAGYRDPGRLTASASYLERIAHGLAADRVVGLSANARPDERLDLSASASLDVRAGLEEARAQANYLATDDLEPELVFVHADPQRMLPAWSILSMFASEVYDQLGVGLGARLAGGVRGRIELGARRSYLPGGGHADENGLPDDSGDDVHVGLSANASVHVRPAPYDRELVVELGHRDEGGQELLLGRIGTSFRAVRELRLSPSVGVAYDANDGDRTAWLARGAADLPLGERWASALVLDFARTPLSRGELRAVLRVSYAPGAGGESW